MSDCKHRRFTSNHVSDDYEWVCMDCPEVFFGDEVVDIQAAHIAELECQLVDLKLDARRYRWLRDAENFPATTDCSNPWTDLGALEPDEFDYWIDQHMSAPHQKEQSDE